MKTQTAVFTVWGYVLGNKFPYHWGQHLQKTYLPIEMTALSLTEAIQVDVIFN